MTARLADAAVSLAVAGLCGLLLTQLEGVPQAGRLFPEVLLWLSLGCCALLLGRALLAPAGRRPLAVWGEVPPRLWLVVVALFVLYVAGVFHVGFFASTFAACLAFTTVLSGERWWRSLPGNLAFAASLTALFYLFFARLMRVPFPGAWLP